MIDDDTPTPKQSNTWNVWKTAAEEMLADLIDYTMSRRKQKDFARAEAAAGLSDETARFIEVMDGHPIWTDELRVLRQTQFFDLRRRFEALMAGISIPPTYDE